MIPLYKVHMPENIGEVLSPVLLSGSITQGPKAKEFEEAFGKFIGNPNTALVNSGTSAITLALRLAGVSPGTEVISSPMTCLATNEPILTLGAKVVWCDIDPTTGNIDPSKIRKLITPKTRAIIFVDWAGTPAELDEINDIAYSYGLKTIEDAAHALGALYKGRQTGTSCDFVCFSFQAIKHLTTVDGGALACRSEKDCERAILLRWFGMSRGQTKNPVCWDGDVLEPGYKFHMNDVNATIGLEQLKHINFIIDRHRSNGSFFSRTLAGINSIELLKIPEHIQSSYWIYTLKLRDIESRRIFSERLKQQGVMSAITHTRNDTYSLFKDSRVSLPGMDDFGSRMLNIPCGWWVSEEDRQEISKTILDIL